MRRLLLPVLAAALLAAPAAAHQTETKQPTAVGTGGAAATVDQQATQAAIGVLRRGGNAVDAAVGAASVLGVVEPYSCGIGGGGFMTIYSARDGEVHTIDSRETAPEAMDANSFAGLTAFESQRVSGMSVGVPGTLRAWQKALDEYGTWPLRRALVPGIVAALHGFVVDPTFHQQTLEAQSIFNDFPATAALYLKPDGTPKDVGTVIRNPDLARTYALIARNGPDAFYSGKLAQAIVDTVTHPPLRAGSTRSVRPGVMTLADLASYEAIDRDPTSIGYRGLQIDGMGPPSSGGSTVGEILNILEGYDMRSLPREQALHYYLEASRYAYADRGAYLGDPGYVSVPLAQLLSDDFAARRPVRGLRHERVGHPRGLDDQHDGLRSLGQRRRLHVHDRAERRQRHCRARLRLPAQQRADRLQPRLRRDQPGELQPGRRRQAPALVDRSDHRAARRQAVAGARLAGRCLDHHDGRAGPAQPPVLRHDAARGDCGAAPQPAQQRHDPDRGRVPVDAGGGCAGRGRAVAARGRQRDGRAARRVRRPRRPRARAAAGARARPALTAHFTRDRLDGRGGRGGPPQP